MADDPKTITLGGVPVRVGTDEECAQATYVVCCRADVPSDFPDNVTGLCGICAAAIYWRPYMPSQPMKICWKCFMKTARPS
jgi:hypothetical protein